MQSKKNKNTQRVRKNPLASRKKDGKLGHNINGNTDKKEREIVITLTPSLLVLASYILLLVSKFIDVTLLNRDNEYMSVIILQMMIFLLPAALWCMMKGEKYIKNLRLSLPKADTLFLIVCAAFVMMTGGILIAIVFQGLDGLSNNFSLYGTFISKQDGSVGNTLYLILAYAALPAVCEEFLFRGILCHEYESKGVFRAIALSSLFFALLHFNVQNLLVYLFCGVILALVLYATRSLWGAVVAHFLYNLFGVFGQPYIATLYRLTKDSRLLLMVVGIVFFLSAALFCSEASRLYKKYLRHGLKASYRTEIPSGNAYFTASFLDVLRDPFTLAAFGVYILALIISFF